MPLLFQARIVVPHEPIPDPQGANAKEGRRFVVISDQDEIDAGNDLILVAISSVIKGGTDEVTLSYGQNSRTGLDRPSVAVCSWICKVPQNAVNVTKHLIRPSEIEKILMVTRT